MTTVNYEGAGQAIWSISRGDRFIVYAVILELLADQDHLAHGQVFRPELGLSQ